jgi:SPP1 family predicted phage head-tail adaptor
MTPLPAGHLRRQITLQRRATGMDADGQQLTTWSDVCTTWASIEPAAGRELLMGQAMQSEITHRVTIRWRTGVTSAMRVLYQGTPYNVHAVIDVEMRHHALELLCSQGLNQG